MDTVQIRLAYGISSTGSARHRAQLFLLSQADRMPDTEPRTVRPDQLRGVDQTDPPGD